MYGATPEAAQNAVTCITDKGLKPTPNMQDPCCEQTYGASPANQRKARVMARKNLIILHDVTGFSRKSGVDADGCTWVEFEVDVFAEQLPGVCSICGAELESGWLCMDGGEEVCDRHVTYADDR